MFEEHRSSIQRGKVSLCEGDFFSEFYKRVFGKIMELQESDGGFSFSLLGEFFSPDEMGRLQGLEQKRRALTKNGADVLAECVVSLKSETGARTADSSLDDIQRLLDQKRQKMKKQ